MEQQSNTAAHAEHAAQQLWEKEKTYDFQNGLSKETAEGEHRPVYSIDTPPPTISGALHIGHVFSYTQTDFIARYKRMTGYAVFYPIGFDNNGLATERFVEKTHNVSPFQIGRTAFIELCLKQTAETEKEFENLFKRLGLSFDWSKTYSTISKPVRKISQQSFIELYKNGHIYRKEEPALYCPACRTSVAQAELEDAEKPSVFYEIEFTTNDGTPLRIATTRPELLSSCVALFYNPKDTRYQKLVGTQVRVPLFDLTVPILADQSVVPEKGTGLVMCCTFGDKTDIEWFKKYQLPYRQSIGRDGRMTERAGILKGLKVAQARERIVQELEKAGILRGQKAISHAVNIHERCKQEIEYLALPQWFIALLPHKEQLLTQGDKIDWHPTFMKSRYVDWVENLSWDWCLSRQRFYGIPFPVWYCTRCSEIVLASEQTLPVDPQETPPPVTLCPRCASTEFIPDTDIMDTWNTSSLTPYICRDLLSKTHPELLSNFLPMSMRPQAHDIIRTWAFYTIAKALMHDNKIPWEKIVISGHVLTGQGQKISKSQANSPLIPDNLLKTYPADAVRYWTASAKLGQDVAFSEAQLKIGQRLLVKLINAFKFIHEHIREHQLDYRATRTDITEIANQWLLHTMSTTFAQYQKSFDEYEFAPALEAAERFFRSDFCDNYLELIKDQLFNPGNYSAREVEDTRHTLGYVGLNLLQFFAPFMPHITETLYQEVYRAGEQPAGAQNTSLHLTCFTALKNAYTYPEAVAGMNTILTVIAHVRKLKSDNQLSLKAEFETLTFATTLENLPALQALIAQQEQLIKGITKAKNIACAQISDDRHAPELKSHDGLHEAYVPL